MTATGSPAEQGILSVPAFPLSLSNRRLDVEFAWECTGKIDGPVVLALGGISAHRCVSGSDGGWWPNLVGPGRALDTEHFRVLGIDYLGGSARSTGPRRGEDNFPSISAFDQVELIVRLLDHLGIKALHALVGASYGGMVALAFGERYPDRVERLLVLSAADRAHPLSTAWRSIERQMVRFGIANGDALGGLKLARALAMTTYRTPKEFAARFQGDARLDNGVWRLPVEDYVYARGDAYVAVHVPEAFVVLSESIDLHVVSARNISVPVLAIAVRDDQLVPLADVQRLVGALPNGRLDVLDSSYGHDAFLKETTLFDASFASFL